jgi:antirestriction protein
MNEHHEPAPQTENQPDTTTEQHETEPKLSPSIYVASLSDYNNGVLHGTWMDAAREPHAIRADIAALLQKSRQPDAEEFAIHDYEQFGRWRVHEYDSIDLVARIANGIAEHGDAFSAWADLNESEPERFNDFTEAYLGHYDSLQDYVDQMADDLGYIDELAKLPEHLQPYVRFDTAGLARDMQLSGEVATVDDPLGGVWIFRTDV